MLRTTTGCRRGDKNYERPIAPARPARIAWTIEDEETFLSVWGELEPCHPSLSSGATIAQSARQACLRGYRAGLQS